MQYFLWMTLWKKKLNVRGCSLFGQQEQNNFFALIKKNLLTTPDFQISQDFFRVPWDPPTNKMKIVHMMFWVSK